MDRPTETRNDRASELALTPLGPGGRPFARWRPLVALLALGALGIAVVFLLSARAPHVLGAVSDRVTSGVDRRAPTAGMAARRAVGRTGVEEHDTLAHIGLWSGVTLLAGLATWSWRSLVSVLALVVLGSVGLELVQHSLSSTRVTEGRDALANLVGIGIGSAVVIGLSSVSGAPAIVRRWRRSQE